MINRLNLFPILNYLTSGKFSTDSNEISINSADDQGNICLTATIDSDTIEITIVPSSMYATAYTYAESNGSISGAIIAQKTIPDCTLTKFANCLFNLCDNSVELLTMSKLTITTAPTKVDYTVGEVFNPAGMVLEVTYSDNSTEEIPLTDVFIDKQIPLSKTDTKITFSYTECGQTISTTQAITVS